MALAGYSMTSAPQFIGRELGCSDWLTIDQGRINQFAACTGDHQWIHVDVERAKRESPFRSTVAHGYLTLSLIAPVSREIGVLPAACAAGFNSGLDTVRFLAPVKAGARVRLRVVLVGVESREADQLVIKTKNTLEIDGSDKPALIAETLALIIPSKAKAVEAGEPR